MGFCRILSSGVNESSRENDKGDDGCRFPLDSGTGGRGFDMSLRVAFFKSGAWGIWSTALQGMAWAGDGEWSFGVRPGNR
jgi:hypothetical protein